MTRHPQFKRLLKILLSPVRTYTRNSERTVGNDSVRTVSVKSTEQRFPVKILSRRFFFFFLLASHTRIPISYLSAFYGFFRWTIHTRSCDAWSGIVKRRQTDQRKIFQNEPSTAGRSSRAHANRVAEGLIDNTDRLGLRVPTDSRPNFERGKISFSFPFSRTRDSRSIFPGQNVDRRTGKKRHLCTRLNAVTSPTPPP